MKKLFLIWLFSGSLDGIGQDTLKQAPDGTHYIKRYEPKPDTLCEWMHISVREVGFVVARKALAVRQNGFCVAHLQADRRPFPVHFHVGWCQGKEELFNRLIKEGSGK